MRKENQDIRNLIEAKGLKLWQVAYFYGANDGNFSRLLRVPLSDEKRERVLKAIDEAERAWVEVC